MSLAIPSLRRIPAAQRGITIGDFLVPTALWERISPLVRHVGLTAAGALLIYLTARVSVTLPGTPIPFTLQTFGVLVVGGALGLRRGAGASALYIALGVVGLPFFAEDRGGLAVLWGTSGGYLAGFVVAAALVGWLAEQGWDRRLGGSIAAALLASAVIWAMGAAWLGIVAGLTPGEAFAKGVAPFLLGDVVKLLAAAVVFPPAWWVLGRRPSDG